MLKLLPAVLLLSCSAPAFACSCVPWSSPDGSYESASAVFVARLTALPRGELRITRGKLWKGNAPAEFVVPSFGSCTLSDVQADAEYIVYASENLQVHMCSRKRLLQQSSLEARRLDALQAGRKTDFAAELSASFTRPQQAGERAEAVRLMQEVLSDRHSGVRAAALEPAIVQGAKDRNLEVRLATVPMLAFVHTRAGLDARIAALRDAERSVRAAAILAVHPIPEADSPLFQALVAALQRARAEPEPDVEKQQALLHALSQQLRPIAATDAEKDQATKSLRELIEEIKKSWQLMDAVSELGKLRERAREAGPQLLQVLKRSDYSQLTEYTITALADIGAVEMRAEIEPYVMDKNCSVVGAVVAAIWTLDKAGFNRFWVEKGAPEMRSRFNLCGDEFTRALQKTLPADDFKDSVKYLLDSSKYEP